MTAIPTIRLLILNDSLSEAERLISMLNNAGRPTRAQHIESEEALTKLLKEQTWDLLIAHAATNNVSPDNAVKHIRHLNKDVPMILLDEFEDSKAIVDGMKLGAADVVQLDEDQHLLHVIQRELNSRDSRVRERLMDKKYKETLRRNQQLLDSSRDAIAYLQDGMFLYTNLSFAELLEYEDKDDLECMPLIDIVEASDQERVKSFLKDFFMQSEDDECCKLSFKALTEKEEVTELHLDVRKSLYDEETCIQFFTKVKNAGNSQGQLEATLEQIKHQDLVTGLNNKNYLLEKLDEEVVKVVEEDGNSALVYIAINDFIETVQNKLGVASSDIVLGTIAAHAKSLCKSKDLLCRFSEESFMLLAPGLDHEAALPRATSIAQSLRDHIIDIDGATLQFDYLLSIALITDETTTSNQVISQARKAMLQLVEEHKKDSTQFVKVYAEKKSAEDSGPTTKQLAKMVSSALEVGKFTLLFQPILSLRGSEKEHYEVLLRMNSDDENGMSPTEFLDVAAQIGATTKIDRWVILEAIKTLSQHRAAGHDTRLLINLSKESLKDTSLPPWLGVAFKAAKLPPDSIIFQIQENDVNDHLNIARSFTEQVTALGSHCSISHFGCALNPFNALQHVSAQYIKVDGSFTQELQDGTGEDDTLKNLVSKIHQEDKMSIVPFVENASVLSRLWQSGVHYIQGYYLQGPAETMDYDFDTET